MRQDATGESMPPEISAATVPPEPTGSPPGPGRPARRGVRDAEDTVEPFPHRRWVRVALEVQHDASRQLDHANGSEVAHRAREILLEPSEEERAVAALEADLVVVDDYAGRE